MVLPLPEVAEQFTATPIEAGNDVSPYQEDFSISLCLSLSFSTFLSTTISDHIEPFIVPQGVLETRQEQPRSFGKAELTESFGNTATVGKRAPRRGAADVISRTHLDARKT